MYETEKWKWSRSVVSNCSRPHGLQPTRLCHPWDFPGKSTGVGCDRLLGVNHYNFFNHLFQVYINMFLKKVLTHFWLALLQFNDFFAFRIMLTHSIQPWKFLCRKKLSALETKLLRAWIWMIIHSQGNCFLCLQKGHFFEAQASYLFHKATVCHCVCDRMCLYLCI